MADVWVNAVSASTTNGEYVSYGVKETPTKWKLSIIIDYRAGGA